MGFLSPVSLSLPDISLSHNYRRRPTPEPDDHHHGEVPPIPFNLQPVWVRPKTAPERREPAGFAAWAQFPSTVPCLATTSEAPCGLPRLRGGLLSPFQLRSAPREARTSFNEELYKARPELLGSPSPRHGKVAGYLGCLFWAPSKLTSARKWVKPPQIVQPIFKREIVKTHF